MFLFPETHQVTAYLKVKSNTGSEVFPTDQRLSPQEIEKQAMNHLALLKSQMVLEAALQKQDIADLDAVRATRARNSCGCVGDLRVSFPGDGEILEIRYEGKEDAEQMAKVVDAVVDAYQDKVLLSGTRAIGGDHGRSYDRLRDQRRSACKEQLEKLERKMASMDMIDPEVEIPRLQREVTRLETQIEQSERRLGERRNLPAARRARTPKARRRRAGRRRDASRKIR